ncbi:MAG: fluoride efflux transporter FluC, partial [Propioniciclava sp.]
TGWFVFHTGDPGLKQVLGTGFLGGYTTFSTACVEAVRLTRGERRGPAAARVLGVLALGVTAAFLGYWLGSL